MVDLSIIIVNYNVRQFLLQCLHSVYRSELGKYNLEVIVVDNDSSDGSVVAVTELYPQAKVIANTDNPGFSKANNQGVYIAKGSHILLLNPDTVVAEDTFRLSLDYMNVNPNVGALGVKMIDGTGTFLPESKRGFPTPWNSFTKLIGLSSILPNVKSLGGYNLSYLDENKIHDIDVLCGAFMLMKKEALDKSGLLDEDFFMYGEDIDLSYRIKTAGYRIVYFPETSIIHYKGESTKKGSLNYVKTFYNAMIIYVKKHYKGSLASLFVMVLSVAIYFRAGLSLISRAWNKLKYVLIDGLLIFGGLHLVKYLWARFHFMNIDHFVNSPTDRNIILYTAVWIGSLLIYGHYSRYASAKSWLRGMVVGTILILVIYALLPMDFRSSRAIILLGAGITLTATWLTTILWNKSIHSKWTLDRNPNKNVLIVANQNEAAALQEMTIKSNLKSQMIGVVSPVHTAEANQLGTLDQLTNIIERYKIDEVIYGTQELSYRTIIDQLQNLGQKYHYKIGSDSETGIVGSNSKDHSGEYYSRDLNYRLNQPLSMRQKRVFDIWSSLVVLILFPFTILINRLRLRSIVNTWKVLVGDKTWISYIPLSNNGDLPTTRPGIIALDSSISSPMTQEQQQDRNVTYARDYEVWDDQVLLLKNLNRIHIIY